MLLYLLVLIDSYFLLDSRKNKLAKSGVGAHGRQGAESKEHMETPSFRTAAELDVSASQM